MLIEDREIGFCCPVPQREGETFIQSKKPSKDMALQLYRIGNSKKEQNCGYFLMKPVRRKKKRPMASSVIFHMANRHLPTY